MRPSRITPIAKATEVSSTSPSGTIGTIPPTVRAMEFFSSLSLTTSWLMTRPIAVGTIIHVTYLRMVEMPLRSSEWTRVKRDASSASCAA
ncbi:replicative DNA helicase [Streptomyces albogriseolus]|uniref:Replicative DNA helicase n=1 Tax=Streptomyces albogriseolus TaxID=1887 RepID=A0ACC6UMN2_STRAO